MPLKKVSNPNDELETRLIEITNYLSLQRAKIALKFYFGSNRQRPIIEIMNFVLYNQDLSEPISTILSAAKLNGLMT